MSSALLWMIAALVAVGVEIVTVDLTFGLIAVGAGSAAVAAALGAPIWLQGVIGVGVALAGIAFVRPFALRHLRRSTPSTRTGVDALTGAEGRALSAVTVVDGRAARRRRDVGADRPRHRGARHPHRRCHGPRLPHRSPMTVARPPEEHAWKP